jgi:hypothetical protein
MPTPPATPSNPANFPIPGSPLVSLETGITSPPWLRFFLNLWQRTGGPNSKIVTSVQIESPDLIVAGSPITTAGIIALTLNDVNPDPGTYGDVLDIPTIVVNGKGLIVAIKNTPISFVSVTGLPPPAAGQLAVFSGRSTITNGDLSGDVSTSGSLVTTLATVNSDVGTYGDATHVAQVTVNAKGLTTAAASVPITFPTAPIPTFGAGAPSTLVSEGALYFNTSTTPYNGYVQHSGAWHQFS